jgi:putative endonuclease
MDNQIDPKLNSHQKGNRGEDLAIEYLLSKGYLVICRNYRSKIGEIDCVAKDVDGTLVFVEVKSSTNSSFGNPLFRITPLKQRTIAKIALQYLREHHLFGFPCRFDVIGVIGERIDHLRNAFFAK